MTTTQTICKERETQELLESLKSIMQYNPITGRLTYKVDRNGGAKIGDEPGRGRKDSGNYKRFTYKNTQYTYHRVCWALYHGKWPKNTIHHKDHDTTNNRINNLEDITQAENNKHKKTYKGRCFKGVYYRSRDKVWAVQMGRDYYGSFKCFGQVYKKAKEVFSKK